VPAGPLGIDYRVNRAAGSSEEDEPVVVSVFVVKFRRGADFHRWHMGSTVPTVSLELRAVDLRLVEGQADPISEVGQLPRVRLSGTYCLPLYEHRPLEEVLTLADTAANLTETIGMGTGTVLIGRAQALAALGVLPREVRYAGRRCSSAEARDAMTKVYATVDRLPAAVIGDVTSLFGWPEHRLRHGESFVYTSIGATREAAEAQERALAIYPEHMVRERAQIELHRATRLATNVLAALPAAQCTEVIIEVARSVVRAIPTTEHRRRGRPVAALSFGRRRAASARSRDTRSGASYRR
jgi:hypothetical protein